MRTVVGNGLAEAGIGASEFDVVIRLARSDGFRLRMTDLAAQTTLSNSGLTRVIDRLEGAGLVDRNQDGADRRVWWARLTDEGLEQVLDVLPDHLATVDEILTGVLDAQELQDLCRALRKIRAVVKPGSDPSLSPLD